MGSSQRSDPRAETRRQFFGKVAMGVGGLALANLMADDAFGLARDGQSFGGRAVAARISLRRRSAASTCT